MSISDLGMLFQFAGGLGMFLYGMNIMADGLQRSAGSRMQHMLGVLTNNRSWEFWQARQLLPLFRAVPPLPLWWSAL